MGDFNARIGNDLKGREGVIGIWGESIKNNNGERLIEFCIQNDMIIQNSFFKHKDCHKYTRQEPGRNEKSIIDYIITERSNRTLVRDVRVYRSAEIASDHYLVVAKIKRKDHNKNERISNPKRETVTIKTYKLQEKAINEKFSNIITEKINLMQEMIHEANLEEKWQLFKNIIKNAGIAACGATINGGVKKRTSWWSEEIQMAVRRKKKLWREYLRRKTQQSYEDYKQERKVVKEKVKEGKAREWENFGVKMEKDSTQNQKLFYRILKNMRDNVDKSKTNKIKDKQGNILIEEKDNIMRWKEHFMDVLNGRDTKEITEIVSKGGNQLNEGDEIKLEEVESAIRKLKNGKAPGTDNIKAELIKYMGNAGNLLLHEIINEAWRNKTVPREWKRSIIVPIYKKGDRKECSNYRGVSLLCTAYKIYERIIEQRLRKDMENRLHETQSGFRPGHSIQDHIFTIRNMSEKLLAQDKELLICFIDLEKAFDNVKRKHIWEALDSNEISRGLKEGIKSLYTNTTNVVRVNNQESDAFITTQGVRQGGVLSPMLFIVFMNEIIKKASNESKKLSVGYNRMRITKISECVFADDITILANNEENLQHNINTWIRLLEEKDMEINTKKTKTMLISNDEHKKIKVNIKGTTIEQVENMQYLGTTFDKAGKYEEEINSKISKATKIYFGMKKGFINNKEISRKTKMKVYKSIYLPTLLSGCETWVLTEKLQKRLQVAEMKFLRRVANVTLMDKIRNEKIRESLEIASVRKYIEKSQLRWWGHMKRLNANRQVRKIWEAKTIGRKKKGRPRRTWDNEVARILKSRGLVWKEAEVWAQDRRKWKRIVNEEYNGT